ncbi:hypothetical protein HOO54_13585 [Bacillus sp. WMMC1349]|uniref:hypothetical protein n=1 Tax=Bacillus sp. WMMC1349 TaxID=2736254 RepID=UPI001554835A|nr:hypothetical protein [Bacillus sp. WMMC1349]NPC93236.1 hypothetical protein [Bacillus sp. WMMC1349]
MTKNDLYSSALDIAFSDSEFLSVLQKKMLHKYLFNGYTFSQEESHPDKGTIYFGVDCPPEIRCLINPSFEVDIDFSSKRVVEIRGGNT